MHFPSITTTFTQWRRHGVDWGGHVHPSLPRSRFSNCENCDKPVTTSMNDKLILIFLIYADLMVVNLRYCDCSHCEPCLITDCDFNSYLFFPRK